ncbi:MAG: UDP-N-acetylmuramoyl-L-alanine--D-glutamate ligase [Patescibacteria group bacterium]|jgi:UDP-N-acetylmuramoylalanine--D-glutamate ligase
MLLNMVFFQSKKLKKFPEIIQATASESYQPLSFVGENGEKVINSRKKFLGELKLNLNQLVLGQQVHGNNIRIIDEKNLGAGAFHQRNYLPKTDGLLTQKANIALGVLTADCIPVLLYDPKTGWLGALHTGWKGMIKEIVPKAIKILKAKGVAVSNLRIWLGPGICQKCYFVNNLNRIRLFEKKLKIKSIKVGSKHFINLKAGLIKQLLSCGVLRNNIEISPLCTFESKQLPSARRDGFKLHKNTLTVIAKKPLESFLAGKKIAIYGLGIQGGGESSVRFAVKANAKVSIFDDKPRIFFKETLKKLRGLPIKYYFGKIDFKALSKADLIVKNPGINPNNKIIVKLKKAKIPMTNDISIFKANSANPIYAITGTKGKTTTATWLAYLIKEKTNPVLAGNLKISPLLQAKAFDGKTPVIFELSSFQLEDLSLSLNAKLTIVTNLYPDHLNRHKSLFKYSKIKARIFEGQSANDIAILPLDSFWKKFNKLPIKPKIYWTSFSYLPNSSAWIEKSDIVLKINNKKIKIISIKQMKLQDQASLRNAINVALAGYLLGLPLKTIKNKLKNFKGVNERFELVKFFKGRNFINNTTATNPIAAVMALRSIKTKPIVICGGSDKNLEFAEYVKEINKKAGYVIFLPGSATNKMQSRVKAPKYIASSMVEAVNKAWEISKSKDSIILNPGAASFGLFKNEFDRGEKFVQAVKNLK